MNRIYLIFMIILISFSSCNGFGSVDINIQAKNVEVSSKDIVGIWKIDKFSYKYLSEFKQDSIRLSFKDDNTFEMNNSHNLFNREINNERINGTWEIIEKYNVKSVKLNFNEVNISKELNIYKKKDNYQLWYFLSDPDIGERIRLLK